MHAQTHHSSHAGGPPPRFSQAQLQEMGKIAKPEFGIGFAFDSDYIQDGEFERWYRTLTPMEKEGLKNPSKTVTLYARASKAGSDAYNLKLSQRRANEVAKRLRDLQGFAAKIEINALGESRSSGPDGKDNHADRTVFVLLTAETPQLKDTGDLDNALMTVWELRQRPKKNQAAWQQMGILYDVALKPLKKVYDKVTKQPWTIKGPGDLIPQYKPWSMAKDFGEREGKWMGVQFGADLTDRKILGRLMASTPWGVINGLELNSQVTPSWFEKNPIYFSPTYYLAGVDMASSIYNAMDADERKNLKLVLSDRSRKEEFAKRLLRNLTKEWSNRSSEHASREFKTGLDTALKMMEQHGL